MQVGLQREMEDMVVRKLAVAVMRGNVLVMIGTMKNVKRMWKSMDKEIASGNGLYHMLENMVVENLVGFALNGDILKDIRFLIT